MSLEIIERKDLYEFNKPIERTKERLMQIHNIGMQEVGIAEFGIKGIVSGLYIEKVWSFSDEEFNDYINWVIKLKNEKKG